MNIKKYLIEGKINYSVIKKALLNGIDNDRNMDRIVSGLEKYLNDRTGMIYLQGGRNTLVDELWYRLASSLEDSESYTTDVGKRLKKNFTDFVNKQSKNFILDSSGKNKYFIHKDTKINR